MWTRCVAILVGLRSAEKAHDSTTTWVMSNHDVPRHVSRYGLPRVPASSHHQLAKDWLLRDGTSYFEDRELGTVAVRAAILMELSLPRFGVHLPRRGARLAEVADILWIVSRIRPRSSPANGSSKRVATVAACLCRGSPPTCLHPLNGTRIRTGASFDSPWRRRPTARPVRTRICRSHCSTSDYAADAEAAG